MSFFCCIFKHFEAFRLFAAFLDLSILDLFRAFLSFAENLYPMQLFAFRGRSGIPRLSVPKAFRKHRGRPGVALPVQQAGGILHTWRVAFGCTEVRQGSAGVLSCRLSSEEAEGEFRECWSPVCAACDQAGSRPLCPAFYKAKKTLHALEVDMCWSFQCTRQRLACRRALSDGQAIRIFTRTGVESSVNLWT